MNVSCYVLPFFFFLCIATRNWFTTASSWAAVGLSFSMRSATLQSCSGALPYNEHICLESRNTSTAAPRIARLLLPYPTTPCVDQRKVTALRDRDRSFVDARLYPFVNRTTRVPSVFDAWGDGGDGLVCLLYTSPSPRD